jgi:HPt (histidine-containing phosphotransfer) domain-containing protein
MTNEIPSVFDAAAFERRTCGDRTLALEILNMFLGDCPMRVAAIRAAVEQGNGQSIRTAAHILKGSASYLSAMFVVDAAARLELIGREESLAEAAAALDQLEGAVAQVMPELQRATLTL